MADSVKNIWTKEQERAIKSDSGNILVAASAGSGKTAVLTERILSHVFPEDGGTGTDIDRMLVITFTEDAAAEMKRRIGKKLRKTGEEAKKDISEAVFRQQTLLANADIETLHSFCYSVCKSYPAESGIDRNSAIAAEDEKKAMIYEAFRTVSEKYYGEKTEGFEILCRLCVKDSNDDNLFEAVNTLLAKAENEPDADEWLKRVSEVSVCDFFSVKGRENNVFMTFYEGVIEDIKVQLSVLEKLAGAAEKYGLSKKKHNYELFYENRSEALKLLENSELTPAQMLGILRNIAEKDKNRVDEREKKSDVYSAEELKTVKEYFKSLWERLKNTDVLSMIPTEEELADEYAKLSKAIPTLCRLTKDVSDEYEKNKKKKRMIDFSDMEKGAIRVLAVKENGELRPSGICMAYREKFSEVYVDEYQDINSVQNAIIRLIAGNDDERKNLFTVGDLKQSIYGFRGSDPGEFIRQTKTYAEASENGCPERAAGELIRLNRNFRSRKCITDGVNTVFDRIMTEKNSHVNYAKDERLIFGAERFLSTPEKESPCEICFSTDENYTAGRIKELLKDKDVKKTDIAVLCRSRSHVKKVTKMLNDAGISAESEENKTKLSECDETCVILDILRLAVNTKNDRALYSVLRSEAGGMCEDEIARIRLEMNEKKSTFYDACRKFSEKDGEAAEKLRKIFEEINGLAAMSLTEKVSSVIWSAANMNGFYKKCGKTARDNIQRLFFLAEDFENKKDKGLYKFVRFADDENKTSSWAAANRKTDAVTVMTVHKSKGLQFPIVIFYMGTAADSRKPDMIIGGGAAAIKSLVKGNNNFTYGMINRNEQQKSKEEELRILYVALTRAEEKLLCICSSANMKHEKKFVVFENDIFDSDGKIGDAVINAGKVLWEYIYYPVFRDKNSTWKIIFDDKANAPQTIGTEENSDVGAENTAEGEFSDTAAADTVIRSEKEEQDEEIFNGNDFSDIPVKISVTEIKRLREQEDSDDYVFMPVNVPRRKPEALSFEEKEVDVAAKGTLVHMLLQYADLEQIKIITQSRRSSDDSFVKKELEELFETEADELLFRGLITEKEREAVETELVCGFFMSGKAERMLKSENIMREVPFTMLMSWKEITGKDDEQDVPVSVQGVIDCIFEEDGGFVIYDYKTDNVTGEDAQERKKAYGYQIGCYTKAAERILKKKVKEAELIFLRNC